MVEIDREMFENFVLKCIRDNVFPKTYEFEIVRLKELNRDVVVIYLLSGFGVCSFSGKTLFVNINNLNRKEVEFLSRFDEIIINNILFKFELKDWYVNRLKKIERVFVNQSDYKLLNLLFLKDNIKNDVMTKETLEYIIYKLKNHRESFHISFVKSYRMFLDGKIKIVNV